MLQIHSSILKRTLLVEEISVTIKVIINASNPKRGRDYEYIKKLFVDNPQYRFEGFVQETSTKKISETIKRWSNENINAIFIVGGTGFEPSDNTPEIMAKFEQTLIPGYGHLLSYLSYNSMAAQNLNMAYWFAAGTRASACCYQNTIIYGIPGSRQAIAVASGIIINSLNRTVYNMFYKQNEKLQSAAEQSSCL